MSKPEETMRPVEVVDRLLELEAVYRSDSRNFIHSRAGPRERLWVAETAKNAIGLIERLLKEAAK